MGKISSYAALAANAVAAGDQFIVNDTSATACKSVRADVALEGLLRVASTVISYDATSILPVKPVVITTASAHGLCVGRLGTTTPGFEVDCSTATNVTGIKITPAAAAAGVAILVTSSGTDENVTFNAKGAGTISLNSVATGNVIIGTKLQMGSGKAIVDANGNELLLMTATVGSAINEITVTNAAAGNGPKLAVTGGDTNAPLSIDAKGSGVINLNATATGNVKIGTNLQLASAKAIVDANGNEILLSAATVASAVNEVTITNAATTTPPTLSATGGDTNVSLRLTPKGTGAVQCAGPHTVGRSVTSLTDTATVTAAQVFTGIIEGDPTAPATYTLPTAALLVGGLANARVGDSFDLVVSNIDAALTITVAAGASGTARGTLTVGPLTSRLFRFLLTNVTGASETYKVFGLGI